MKGATRAQNDLNKLPKVTWMGGDSQNDPLALQLHASLSWSLSLSLFFQNESQVLG